MATRIISRDAAKASGLKRFFTGEPCSHGHTVERYVSSGNCVECAALRFDEWYAAKYGTTHQTKTRNAILRDVARTAKSSTYISIIACDQGHYDRRVRDNRCVECSRARGRDWWRKGFKEKYAKNGEYIREANREWRRQNPEIVRKLKRVSQQRRRKRANGGDYTRQDVDHLLKRQKGKCIGCRNSIRDGFEIDHILPLALGGKNTIRNIQLLCPTCNRKKGAKHPLVWAKDLNRLL